MADENYVEVSIKARDDGAGAELDDIKLKLDEVRNKVAQARVGIEGDDRAIERLDMLDVRLTRLGEKVARPRVTPEGIARTEAELRLVDHQLDSIQRKSAEAGAEGAIGTFLNGEGGAGIAGPLGVVAIAGAFTFLAEQIAAILGPLAAAGIGLGAFAALAIPTLDKVKNAYTGIQTAQKNYNAAVALDKLDPTKANATAAANALDKLRVAWSNLDPVTRGILHGIQGITSEFSHLAKDIAPEVLKIFDDLLPGIHQLVGDLGPFATAIGPVLDRMAKSFSQFTVSPGFRDFLNTMLKLSGPALATIGEGIGKIAVAIGKALEASAKGGGLKDLGRDFSIIAGAIRIVIPALVSMANTSATRIGEVIRWTRDLVRAFDAVKSFALTLWASLRQTWNDIYNFIAQTDRQIYNDMSTYWHAIVNAVTTAINAVLNETRALPGQILHALGDLGSLLWNAGASLINGLLNGIKSAAGGLFSFIGSIAGKIASLKGPLDKDAVLLVPHGKAIMDGLLAGMSSRLPALAGVTGQASAIIAGTGGGVRGIGAGGGQRIVIEFAFSGDADLVHLIRKAVRVRGGSGPDSVQLAFGQGR